MKVRFCDNNKGKGKVVRRLEEEMPELNVKIKKCLGYCSTCEESPLATVDGEKIKGKDADDLYRRIVAAVTSPGNEGKKKKSKDKD